MEYSTPVLDTQDEVKRAESASKMAEPFHLRDPFLPTLGKTSDADRKGIFKLIRSDVLAFSAFILLGIIVLCAVAAPLLTPYDKDKIDLTKQYLPPSLDHPFGTDDMGRDFFIRVMYGGRVSLSVGFVAVVLALFLGLIAGGVAGYYGNLVDTIIMRLVDLVLSIPIFFVVLFLSGVMRPGILVICLLIGMTQWMEVARLVRAVVVSTKNLDFVDAARALGISDGKIIVRHILPHTTAPVLVATTLGLAQAIIMESALSFLGFGVQPPAPSWGAMLQNAQGFLSTAPWMAIFPGMMIFLTVVSCYVLGDFLGTVLHPIRLRNL